VRKWWNMAGSLEEMGKKEMLWRENRELVKAIKRKERDAHKT
jgi:hypothetical protein